MNEHVARTLYHLEVHLLYASLVCLAAWGLTAIVRGSATAKYWIWVATAVNFLLPLGALIDYLWRSRLAWATPLPFIGKYGVGFFQNATVAAVLASVWVLGAIVMLGRLWLRIQAERYEVSTLNGEGAAYSDLSSGGIPVRFSEARRIPAVEGVIRPYISLPEGIGDLLTESELKAVIVHELAHARRRDNLLRLIYEIGRCALWFHPLYWLTGSRLALYRELSCDEAVIANAQTGALVSALSKLAQPPCDELVLRASASSFLSDRLARLIDPEPRLASVGVSALLILAFTTALLAGVLETVAHTACCFIAKA